MRSLFIPVTFCIITLLVFSKPLFKPGLIAGHDTGTRFVHIQLMAHALRDGQFPVRWVEGPVPGLSHPLFAYYPPLFYYFSALFVILGTSAKLGLYLTLIASVALGWVGMYGFAQKLEEASSHLPPSHSLSSPLTASPLAPPPLVASLAATLFSLTPYRISQLYVRAAYLELAATSFIPFAFWGVSLICTTLHKKSDTLYGFVMTTVSLGLMIIMHQPTFMMTVPALILWIMTLTFLTPSKTRTSIALSTIVASLLLVSSFLLPLIGERAFIRQDGLSSGYFDFHQHFATFSQMVYSAWGYGISQLGSNDGMSFQVGVINWIVLACAVGIFLYNQLFKKKILSLSLFQQTCILFFLIITTYGVFMSTPISLPLWERFPLLAFLQYPWRYLAITTFATSALVVFTAPIIPKRYLPFFFIIIIVFNWKYLAPATHLSDDVFIVGSNAFPKTNPLYGLEPSYLPRWVTQTNADPLVPRFQVLQGKAQIQEKTMKTTVQEFTARVETPTTIRVNTHYFPGWIARVNNGQNTTAILPSYDNAEGNMEITLTPGEYTVTFMFTNTPLRTIADYLSLGTIVGLLGLLAFAAFSRNHRWSKYDGAISPALEYHEKAVRSSRKSKK